MDAREPSTQGHETLAARLLRLEQQARAKAGARCEQAPATAEPSEGQAHEPLSCANGAVTSRKKGQTRVKPVADIPALDALIAPLIVKSNRLVEACYDLTLAELRVLMCVLADINSHPSAIAINSNTRFDVSVERMSSLFAIPKKDCYPLIHDAVERLGTRWITVVADALREPWPDRAEVPQSIEIRWIYRKYFYPRKGTISIFLSPDVIPFVTQLSREFTSYRLLHVSNMTSVYAIRLFELLTQWQSRGQRELGVEWLKRHFQIVGEYQRIGNLKSRVIEPAVDQINRLTNMSVAYAQRKAGRRVVSFVFRFSVSRHSSNATLTQDEIARNAFPGETWEQATMRLRQKDRGARGPKAPGSAARQ